jgi:alkylhydroperoxidase/carboxymuconolactone decarboxylase family protein YurZ
MVTKLARNALTFSTWAAVREAASIAHAGGVPLDRLLAVLESADDEGTAPLARLTRMVAGAAVPPEQLDWVDTLMQKDLAAAQAFAGAVGLEVPIVDVVRPRMRAAYGGELPAPLPPPADARARGVAMMNRTYGPGFGDRLPAAIDNPSLAHTVDRLFAEVWARPYLTVRDRRLLTIGATAMLGRGDLLEVQLRGALANGELTDDQLRELALHLHYYAGWGNGTTVQRVVEQLIGERRGEQPRPPRERTDPCPT